MHRCKHKINLAATEIFRSNGSFKSRYSYVSLRIHPGGNTHCVYLAGADCEPARRRVFERDDYKCVDCHKPVPFDGPLTIRGHLDHGGTTKVTRCWCEANLFTRCYECHMLKKHAREPMWSSERATQ